MARSTHFKIKLFIPNFTNISQSLLIQHHCLLAACSISYKPRDLLTLKSCNLVAIYDQSDYCTYGASLQQPLAPPTHLFPFCCSVPVSSRVYCIGIYYFQLAVRFDSGYGRHGMLIFFFDTCSCHERGRCFVEGLTSYIILRSVTDTTIINA